MTFLSAPYHPFCNMCTCGHKYSKLKFKQPFDTHTHTEKLAAAFLPHRYSSKLLRLWENNGMSFCGSFLLEEPSSLQWNIQRTWIPNWLNWSTHGYTYTPLYAIQAITRSVPRHVTQPPDVAEGNTQKRKTWRSDKCVVKKWKIFRNIGRSDNYLYISETLWLVTP